MTSYSLTALDYFTDHAIDPAVAISVGVTERDDFTLVFPYEGFERLRSLNGAGPKVRQPKGVKLVPWLLPGTGAPIITEGEPDALAARTAQRTMPQAAGLSDSPVIAIPGTSCPVETVVEAVKGCGASEAFLALDADEAGRKATDKLVLALRVACIRPIVVDLPDGLDLSDWLVRLPEDERGQGLANLLIDTVNAPDDDPDGDEDGPSESASTLTPFTDIKASRVEWVWRDRIARAKMTALSGRPKIGKGLLYSDLAAKVTRGTLEGDLEGARDVIIVTTEDDPGDTLKPRLMAAAADLSRVSYFQMGSPDDPVPFRVPEHAEELGQRIHEREAALVVIDPLIEFIDGSLDTHKSQAVRHALSSLNPLAREHGCAILAVIHLNKGASTDTHLRHEASAAFTQVVRGGLLLGRDPDDPEGEAGDQRVLAVSSSNLARIPVALVYRIESATVDGDDGELIDTAKMIHTGESAADSHELLRGHDPEEAEIRADAEEFLRAELKSGPCKGREIEKAASFARTTLFRARKTLGVDVAKEPMKDGAWWWKLPQHRFPWEESTGEDSTPTPEDVESSRNPHEQAGNGASESRRFHPVEGETFGAEASDPAPRPEPIPDAEAAGIAAAQVEADAGEAEWVSADPDPTTTRVLDYTDRQRKLAAVGVELDDDEVVR